MVELVFKRKDQRRLQLASGKDYWLGEMWDTITDTFWASITVGDAEYRQIMENLIREEFKACVAIEWSRTGFAHVRLYNTNEALLYKLANL